MKEFINKYKYWFMGGIALISIIGIIILASRLTIEYSVQEVIYDTQRGELFIVRSDGKEFEQELKINIDDTLFRDNKYLIHRNLTETGEYKSTVYNVFPETLEKAQEVSGYLLSYSDKDNYIYSLTDKTVVFKDGSKQEIGIVCKYASYFKDTFLCVNQSSKLLTGTTEELIPFELSPYVDQGVEYERNVIMINVDSYNNRLYLATATLSDEPVNEVHVISSLEQLNDETQTYEKYITNEVPRLITVQHNRTILNVLKRQTQGDKVGAEFSLYVMDNGLKPLKGYRYPLLIVY